MLSSNSAPGDRERPPHDGQGRSAAPDAADAAERSSRAAGTRPADAAAALLTPPGRGALAVVGIRGTDAAAIIARLFRPHGRAAVAEWPPGRIGAGAWRGAGQGGIAPEEVVLVRTAPGFEIHGHGGLAAPAAILDDLGRAGAAILDPDAWERAGSSPTVAAEAALFFARARGPRAARILARQAAGALEAAFAELRRLAAAGDRAAAVALGDRLLAAARVGLRLARPWRVVVAGPVNAGKSSLVNALAGHARSIVSAEPGTTRDAVETALVLGGWEVILVDTAGTPAGDGRAIEGVERAGIERAAESLRDADLVLRVAEAAGGAPAEDAPGTLVVRSKADLAPGAVAAAGGVIVSVHAGTGIEPLADAIVARLVPEEAADRALLDGPVPFLERHLAVVRGILADVARQ